MQTLALRPWYRQLWPWLLMIGPTAAVLGGAATLWLAIVSDDGLVADDYYKQGMAINRTLARERVAQQLGLRAAVEVSSERLNVVLASDRGAKLPTTLSLRVVHPTRALDDQTIVLQRDAQGGYVGFARLPARGQRTLILEDAAQTWRLVGTFDAARASRSELLAHR